MICQTSRTGTIAKRHREDHTDAPNEAVAGRVIHGVESGRQIKQAEGGNLSTVGSQ